MSEELDRRAFLRRLAATAAFAVPVVTSFSMTSVGQAFASTGEGGALPPPDGQSANQGYLSNQPNAQPDGLAANQGHLSNQPNAQPDGLAANQGHLSNQPNAQPDGYASNQTGGA